MIIASAIVYYSLREKQDPIDKYFLISSIFFMIVLLVSDYKLFRKSNMKIIYYDIFLILWIILIPNINLAYGLSRLIMAIGAFSYGFYMVKIKGRLITDS